MCIYAETYLTIIMKVDESFSKVDSVLDGNTESDNQHEKQNDSLQESSLNQSSNAMEKSSLSDEKVKFEDEELPLTASDQELTVEGTFK